MSNISSPQTEINSTSQGELDVHPLGLSLSHISPSKLPSRLKARSDTILLNGRPVSAIVVVAQDASAVTLRSVGGGQSGGGKRGKVSGFSRGSRRRLLTKLNSIPRDVRESALFVTLTYPGVWSDDPKRWKRDLDAFLKRLRAKFPKCAGVWRLEFQKRGAPHYHLLLFGVPLLSLEWVSETWHRVVGSDDAAHLRAGTQVKRMESFKQTISYCAKYIAKDEQPTEGFNGRVWGLFGRVHLCIALTVVRVPWSEWWKLRRLLNSWRVSVERKRKRRRGRVWLSRRRTQGVTAFIDSQKFMEVLLT